MMKHEDKIFAMKSALVGVALAVAPFAHAQTPAYSMDSGVSTAATDLLTSLTAQVFTQIPAAIAIVGGVVATLFGLRWLIGFVRSNMHG